MRAARPTREAPDDLPGSVFPLQFIGARWQKIIRTGRLMFVSTVSLPQRNCTNQFESGQSPLLVIAMGMEKPSTLLLSSARGPLSAQIKRYRRALRTVVDVLLQVELGAEGRAGCVSRLDDL